LPLTWLCLMAIALLCQVALVIEAHGYIWHGFLVLLVLLVKKIAFFLLLGIGAPMY